MGFRKGDTEPGVSCYPGVAEVLGQVKFMLADDLPGFIMVEGMSRISFSRYFDHTRLLFPLRVSQNKAHFKRNECRKCET